MDNRKTNQELINYFQDFLLTKSNKTHATISKIISDINGIVPFLENQSINSNTILDYITHLKEIYLNSTYKAKLSSLRQFCSWLDLEDNPFLQEGLVTKKKETQNYLSEEAYHSLIESANYLAKICISSVYELYLSVEEFQDLRLADFNFANQSFRIRGTSIVISQQLSKIIKKYLNSLDTKDLDYQIFQVDPVSKEKIKIEKILKEYQIPIKELRKSRIVHLLNSNHSLDQVNELLGIQLGKTYQQYEKPKENYVLLKDFKNFHPRA